MTTNPPPDARNAPIYVATANVAVMDILSGREHLLRVSVSSYVGGELRVGEQLVQALVSADETRLAGRDRLIVSHSSSSSWAVSRFHWSISGSARAAAPS